MSRTRYERIRVRHFREIPPVPLFEVPLKKMYIIDALKALEAKHKRGIKLVLAPLPEPKPLLNLKNLMKWLGGDEKIVDRGIRLRQLAKRVSVDLRSAG